MPTRVTTAAAVLALATLTACSSAPNAGRTTGTGPWLQYADPADAGYDPEGLDRACALADSLGSAAFMGVHEGRVLFACGAVARELELHSVRKSLVSGLYGTAIARGEIDPAATLAELGIDDDVGLTPAEREATVADLLTARSGVYVPAAYAPSSQARNRPERGSHAPGTHWFYNNWDFNVAGVIYERTTGEDLYRSFDRRIAGPIGMEDWTPDDGFLAYEPTRSRHPAHTFRMSARDLARFGLLYLRDGEWDGRQVIPADWVRRTTTPVSDLGDGAGYAYMWWTYEPGALSPERYPALSGHRIILGRGTGSQGLWIIPALDLVMVHRADTDHDRGIDGRDAWTLAETIVAARAAAPAAGPRLVDLEAEPFESQLPPYDWPADRPVAEAEIDAIAGDYPLAPGAVIRVFRFRDQPYIHVPREGDARLIPLGDGAYTIRVVPGVRVEFERDDAGDVVAVELTLAGETMRAERR